MIFKTNISAKDVKRFADISLDKNPIHLNEKFARRQFYGKKISHGALLIEKFIIFYFKNRNYLIENFVCNFNNPCEVNSNIVYKYNCKNSFVKCTISAKEKKICYFEFKFNNNYIYKKINIKNIKSQKINKFFNKKNIEKILKKKKKFIKFFDNRKNIFLNILYNLSRVIGMEVPGHYSLFFNFQVKINYNEHKYVNFYKVNNIVEKINLIETDYFFKNYSITSTSFLLNPPINFEKILRKKYIISKKTKNQNKQVLILGGSRGLGLMSTFYFLSRGYKVFSTYAIFNNYLIKIKNKNLKIIKYDIQSNLNLKKIKNIAKYSDFIMFFSSPKILNQSGNIFNKHYFNSIHYFNYIFINKILKSLKNKKIFFPSTIFLNSQKDKKFAEYIKSKKMMETYLKSNKIKCKFFVPRLPRFNTDQNNFNLKYEKIENFLNFEKYLKEFENK